MITRRQMGWAAAGGAASAIATAPVVAKPVDKYAEQLQNGEYTWNPDRSPTGPVLIIVSLPDQIVYVYRNGVQIAASTCSTGKLGHRTPTGVFKILQKDKNHRSSTYNNTPMPSMNRLTWVGDPRCMPGSCRAIRRRTVACACRRISRRFCSGSPRSG